MANLVEIIKEQINLKLESKLTQNALKKISTALQNELDYNLRKRLELGIDVNGNKIKKLDISYDRWKRDYIAKRINHRKKSKGKSWFEELYSQTEYKAKSTPNYGRLTGQTLSSFVIVVKSKLTKTGIEFTANMTVKKQGVRSNETILDIIDGLKKHGRDYYSMLAPPTTNVGKKERERLIIAINKVLK